MSDLYGNQPDSSWTWDVALWSPGTTWGTRFRVTANTTITRIGYYQGNTADAAYSWLGLYNTAGTLMWSTSSPTSGAQNTWNWTQISPGIALDTATDYTVAGYLVGVGGQARNATLSARNAPPSDWIFDAHGFYDNTSGQAFPNTPGDAVFLGLGVGFGTSGAGPPGAGQGNPTLTGDNYAWLSNDPTVNTHQTDGLPWIMNQGILGLINTVGNILTIVQAIQSVVNAGLNLAGGLQHLSDQLATGLNNLADWLAGGHGGPGGSAVKRPDGTTSIDLEGQILDAVNTISDEILRQTQDIQFLSAPLAGFPTGFTLQATTSFTDCLSWAQNADVYVMHFTDIPPRFGPTDVCGVNFIPRLAWWSPLDGTLPGERHYLDFEYNQITWAQGQMPGILIFCQHGGGGTIEAYTRNPPA